MLRNAIQFADSQQRRLLACDIRVAIMLSAQGELIRIRVGEQSYSTQNIDYILERFIGGRGVATRIAYESIPFDVEPMGPRNSLIFTTGPLQMSQMSFTGRMNCTGVSPLTDGLVSSNAGGFMSRNFTATGYGAVQLVGAAEELSMVHVTDTEVRFEPVPQLADATVPETCAYIEEAHGLAPEHVACIGPAGERGVRFASIMTSESRAFGRGGLGAVMGAKRIKAITFDGSSTPALELPDVTMDVHRDAATSDHIMKEQGTTSVTELANEVDALPTRYFSEQSFEGVEGISGDRVAEKKYKKGTCSACAFACKLPTRDDATGIETEGPEYETVMAFGSNCGVDDIVDVMRSNELCDRYGLDTISCGNTIAAYLSAEDRFGDIPLITELIEQIAHREGVGDLLAEGIARIHEEIGVDDWTVKGLDFAAHDGRALHGQGLAYATANRGADHMYSTFYAWEYPLVDSSESHPRRGTVGKAKAIIKQENARALEDCGVICRFSRGTMTPERYERLFDASYDTLLQTGAMVIDLERNFNNQRGFDVTDDILPYELPNLQDSLQEYYTERGWSADGVAESPEVDVGSLSAD